MASNRRNREKRDARRAAFREPRRRFLVVCEGQVTEPGYLRSFCRQWKPPVKVVIADRTAVGKTAVSQAIDLKELAAKDARKQDDEYLAYDEVWCVFDVDELTHDNLNTARQLATANGIELAISNPCFELWLLLHFRESPGQHHRDSIKGMVKHHLPDYEKAVEYEDVSNGFQDAMERARRLDQQAHAAGEPGRNPTTRVYELADRIILGGSGAHTSE